MLLGRQVDTDKLQYENRTASDRRQLTEGTAHLVTGQLAIYVNLQRVQHI